MAMNNQPFSGELTVVRRPVKHVRLRVRETCAVEAVVPLEFTNEQIQILLNTKAAWIDRARSFFRRHPAVTTDNQKKLLLFGGPFEFVSDPTLGKAVVIDEEKKVIRASCNLHSDDVRSKWYRKFARDFLRRRTTELAEGNGLSFNRIYVKNQKTVWGSCSRRSNLSLNWQLVCAPRFVIDYVILHELLHTRFMSHSQPFWRSMVRLSERYKDAIDWLNNNRPAIR